jgi:hypothetical protein
VARDLEAHRRRLSGATIRLDFVIDDIALVKSGEARALDRRYVDKNVSAAPFWSDKAKAFGAVEKLDYPVRHGDPDLDLVHTD